MVNLLCTPLLIFKAKAILITILITLGQLVSEWGQNLNEIRNRDEAVALAVKHSERFPR